MDSLYLQSFAQIDAKGFRLNGKTLLPYHSTDFLKKIYQQQKLQYPKFHKMDTLCQMGLLASEIILKEDNLIESIESHEIALLFANAQSSLQSDQTHILNFSENQASPANFVYTLPNIVLGEICIRHKLYSETNFYIFENFDIEKLLKQATILLSTTQHKMCLLGWIDSIEEKPNCHLFLLNKTGTVQATKKHLQALI